MGLAADHLLFLPDRWVVCAEPALIRSVGPAWDPRDGLRCQMLVKYRGLTVIARCYLRAVAEIRALGLWLRCRGNEGVQGECPGQEKAFERQGGKSWAQEKV